MSEFKVGDIVYVNSKSMESATSSNNGTDYYECCELVKITPERYKIMWDCDGQRDEPVYLYVKNIYKEDPTV
mgnify:CR=1 FL=1